MSTDGVEADAERHGDDAIARREHATLLTAFLPIFRLLEVRAALGDALTITVGEATGTILSFADAVNRGQIPADPAVAAWNKFITDLDDTFVKLELAGVTPGKCAAQWQKVLSPLIHDMLSIDDQEKRGKLSHALAAADRKEITNRMKIAGDAYMRCLQMPPRKQVPAGTEGR